jgi:hypothetical protein
MASGLAEAGLQILLNTMKISGIIRTNAEILRRSLGAPGLFARYAP